jgi:hypothetical protein
VRLNESGFVGEMHTLCALPITLTMQVLRHLIAGEQLGVSQDGSQVAWVHRLQDEEVIVHSGFDAGLRFRRSHTKELGGTRILRVDERHVLVWGQVNGFPPGVWFIAEHVRRLLYPIDRIKGSYRSGKSKLFVGESPSFPGENVLITSWGLLPVAIGARIDLYADGTVCVVEEVDGRSLAYQIDEQVITPMCMARIQPAMHLVRWHDAHLLATRTPHRSMLMRVGYGREIVPASIPIDGQIEEIWSSPTHDALLSIVRPRDATGDVRRLFLNNDTLVYEGSFTLTRSDIFWSNGGTSFAARLQVGREGKVHLVTPVEAREFRDHVDVHEVIVNDKGCIQAMIVHDGVWDRPIVRTRRRTAVPLAWNLHEDPDGGIAWNTVHDNLILLWVDRTHLQPRLARHTTR